MIVYFANRKLEVIGHASTELPEGLAIRDDNRIEDIETGVAVLEGRIPYDKETRRSAEECVAAGNYVFRYDDKRQGELFCITEYEHDNKEMECYFYAEDAGLLLLNEVALKWPDGRDTSIAPPMTLTQYISLWIGGTGFEIGENEARDDATTKAPSSLESADKEETVAERIRSIANDFGYEISYSYALNNNFTKVDRQLVNIYKKRGKDTGERIEMNREIDKITVKGNLNNLATAILPIGKDKLDLTNYAYTDDTFTVKNLKFTSREELKGCLCLKEDSVLFDKWARMVNGERRHIIRPIEKPDIDNKPALVAEAVKELKKRIDVEVNYEVDIARLPENINIGDYIYVIDEEAELYLKARVLKLEESVSNNEAKATLGEYLIKGGGISDKVRELAAQFEQIADQRQYYTWVAYADDDSGTGISLSPYNKKFIGIAVNRTTETVDITDPTVFSWVEIVSDKLVAIDLQITSSAGQVFITTKVETTLTAHVYLQGDELTAQQIADIGVIRWYKDGVQTQVTGTTYSITAADNIDAASMSAQLEVEVS